MEVFVKIIGNSENSKFRTFSKEPGWFGSNDVLKGKKETVHYYASIWGRSHNIKTVIPTLYLHIPNTPWSSFTGKLRQYLLPCLWKRAFFDQGEGKIPLEGLVCTYAKEGELSGRLKKILGKSWFVTNLAEKKCYDEIFGREYIRARNVSKIPRPIQINDPLGKWAGFHLEPSSTDILCHIYRQRGLFSFLTYYFLKIFSNDWQEISLTVNKVSEKILIKKSDEKTLTKLNFLKIK